MALAAGGDVCDKKLAEEFYDRPIRTGSARPGAARGVRGPVTGGQPDETAYFGSYLISSPGFCPVPAAVPEYAPAPCGKRPLSPVLVAAEDKALRKAPGAAGGKTLPVLQVPRLRQQAAPAQRKGKNPDHLPQVRGTIYQENVKKARRTAVRRALDSLYFF